MSLKISFILAKRADPDEMPQSVAFHLGLCFLPKYPFTVCLWQWLSGRVLDLRPRGRGLEPHRRHCVVVLGQDTFILA